MSDSKFLTGIILGAIGGILLAPASGKETRDKIADVTADFRKDMHQKLEQIRKEYINSNEFSLEDVKRILMNSESDEKNEVLDKITELEAVIVKKYEDLERETLQMIDEFKEQNINSLLPKNT